MSYYDEKNWAADWRDYLDDKPDIEELGRMITGFEDPVTVRGDMIEPDGCDHEGYPAWTLVFGCFPELWSD